MITKVSKAWDATSQACARKSAPARDRHLTVAALRAHDMLTVSDAWKSRRDEPTMRHQS